MNASVESFPSGSRRGAGSNLTAVSPADRIRATRSSFTQLFPAPGASADAETPLIREGVLELPGEFPLHHGGALREVRLAWRMTGPTAAPVVCALGGISAHRRVWEERGWWTELAGPERPLDSARYRILSLDYLGGSGDSTVPAAEGSFPSISSYDQAEALRHLLDHLQIESLRAITGGSYGGMVALAFGERYPERVSRLLVIGAADRAHPMATAWRSVQRQIVRFALDCGRGAQGLQLARGLAMSTYRSGEEFAARFSGLPVRERERFVFPVENYLFARGADYAARFRAESFLCLSESIDLHRIEANRMFVPTTAVAVREDQLVPVSDVRAMVARAPCARLHEFSSIYGHDAFLKETEQLRRVFEVTLEEVP